MITLKGMIVPLVTPFDSGGAIDEAGLVASAEYAVQHGARGLMLTALTGEGNLLSAAETERVWRAVMGRFQTRVPIVPAIFSTTTADAIRLGTLAASLGASAVMVSAIMPELYGRRAEKHVRCFFERFCSAVSVPVVLFNYPSVVGYDLTPNLIEELAAGLSNIRYIKESTGDSRRISEVLFRAGHRIAVICGSPEIALESLALGCKAWITAITNLIPATCCALIEAMECANLAKARELNFRVVLPMFEIVRQSGNTIGAVKAGLRLRGINVGTPRAPGLPLEMNDRVQSDFERVFRAERELLGLA